MKRALCSCGRDAVWYKAGTTPEEAPEHAVCFLTDDDFADDLCDACFVSTVPEAERGKWKRRDSDDPAGLTRPGPHGRIGSE